MFNKRIKNLQKLNEKQNEIRLGAKIIKDALLNNKKILFCANGGSAADSNHLAAEFVCRFKKERKALAAISLCANNSIITAIANDYSYDDIFKRQIEAMGEDGDILIAISTSGKSKNVLEGIKQAKKQGLGVIFFTGENKTQTQVDLEINAPSCETCEIQEMHIAIGHIICEIVEKELF